MAAAAWLEGRRQRVLRMELSEQPPSPTAAGAGYSCTSRCASAKTKAAVPLPGGAAASSHYGSLHGSRIRTAAGGEPTAERWRVPAFRLTTKKPPHAPKGRLSSRLRRLGSRMGTATRSPLRRLCLLRQLQNKSRRQRWDRGGGCVRCIGVLATDCLQPTANAEPTPATSQAPAARREAAAKLGQGGG